MAACLLWSPAARGDDRAEADRHFALGIAAAQHSDFVEALREFETARSLLETPAVMLNIASCLTSLHRYAEGMDAAERVLALGGRSDQRARAGTILRDNLGRVALATVRVNVADADIRIDGRRVDRQPIRHDLARDVTFEVRKEGYIAVNRTSRRAHPGAYEVAVELQPIQRRGRLLVTTLEGRPARLFLDGVDVGTTPWAREVPAGVHEVELRRVGYRSTRLAVDIPADGEVAREISLAVEANAGGAADIGTQTSGGRELTEPPPRPHTSGASPWPWIGAGGAVVAVATGVVLVVLLATATRLDEQDWYIGHVRQ